MSSGTIVFIILSLILAITAFGALGLEAGKRKLDNMILGFFISGLLPIIGILVLWWLPDKDSAVTQEMYDRGLISKDNYDKTIEQIIHKK